MSGDPKPPSASGPTRMVQCPRCRGPSVYGSSNRFRPFCSERCKAIDFGAWSSENYALHEQPTDPDPTNWDN